MAQKGIREVDAKHIIAAAVRELSGGELAFDDRLVLVTPETDMAALPKEHPWLKTTKLVAKPDQLFGKRGKNNLLAVDKTFDETKAWIGERMNKEVTIEQTTGKTTGVLTHFMIEPFVPHEVEYYLAFTAHRDHDTIHFSTQGGINIEEVWDTVVHIDVPVLAKPEDVRVAKKLPKIPNQEKVAQFVEVYHQLFLLVFPSR